MLGKKGLNCILKIINGEGFMEKQALRSKIEELSPWYQKISIDGIVTSTKREDSEKIWDRIRGCFPENFKLSRILDLGCNAGFYSIMAARMGASVVGVESNPLSYKQAIFLKKYFEELWSTELDITYIQKDISDIDLISLGSFDCVFALAVLYHVGNYKFGKGTVESFAEQNRIISLLNKMTDMFIVRARQRKRKGSEYYDAKHYNKVFKKLGFVSTKTIPEKGRRTLIVYERGI